MRTRGVVIVAVLCLGAPVGAWWGSGHDVLTGAAVMALPDSVPTFVRGAGSSIAHFAIDPDLARNRSLPQLRDRESPEHFLDLELLGNEPIPRTRYGMIAFCGRLDIDPRKVGMLPYALTGVAFALAGKSGTEEPAGLLPLTRAPHPYCVRDEPPQQNDPFDTVSVPTGMMYFLLSGTRTTYVKGLLPCLPVTMT